MNELYDDVTSFLYQEARLLDAKDYENWLKCFNNKLRYWMPVREQRLVANNNTMYHVVDHTQSEAGLAYYDESKRTLRLRINKILSGRAWSELMPYYTRRMISNIEIFSKEVTPEGMLLTVYSNFFIHYSRNTGETTLLTGQRKDKILVEDGSMSIIDRIIYLDAEILFTTNISIFF